MNVSVHRYALPLRVGQRLKGHRFHERRGCLLRIEDAEGHIGWGDCAPLPGFSRESTVEAHDQLSDLGAWLKSRKVRQDWLDAGHPIHAEIDGLGLYPSVRFALELALFEMAVVIAETTLPEALHPDPASTVPINALLTGDDEDALLREAEARAAEGFRTLKVKVGRRSVEEDIAHIRKLRTHLGPDVALRCDANQAWSLADATAFAEGVMGLDIEYVEEPLADTSLLGSLWLDTNLRIALDESLANLDPADLESRAYASAVVLKPTLLGGMLRTLKLAREARRVGIRAVISGAFESGVGMRGHVALACATGGAPAGLDPYNRLAEDVLRPRLPLDTPNIDVTALFRKVYEVVVP